MSETVQDPESRDPNRITNISVSVYEAREREGLFWARATCGKHVVDTRLIRKEPEKPHLAAADAVALLRLVAFGFVYLDPLKTK